MAQSDEIAREKCAPYLRDFWHHFTRIASPGGVIPDRSGYEYWYEEGDLSRYATDDYELLNRQGIIICGSPQTVIGQLRRQAELVGTDRFLLDFWRGSLKREDRISSLELFGTEVIPALRDASITAAA